MTLVPREEWLKHQPRTSYRNRTVDMSGYIELRRTPEPKDRGFGQLAGKMNGKRPPYRRLPGERGGPEIVLSASSLADRRIQYRAVVADLMNQTATDRRKAWEKEHRARLGIPELATPPRPVLEPERILPTDAELDAAVARGLGT